MAEHPGPGWYPRPVPGDADEAMVADAIGEIGTEHMWVTDIEVFAAEFMSASGATHVPGMVLTLAGKYNKSHEPGRVPVLLDAPGMMLLFDQLRRTMSFLVGAGVMSLEDLEAMVAQAEHDRETG